MSGQAVGLRVEVQREEVRARCQVESKWVREEARPWGLLGPQLRAGKWGTGDHQQFQGEMRPQEREEVME